MINHLGWSGGRAGLVISSCGITGMVFLLSFPLLLKYMTDLNMLYYGLVLMTISCVLMTWGIFWTVTPVWVFCTAAVMMYAVGYPIGHTALIGVFAKITHSGPQGGLMGIFGSAGSLARVFFPIVAGVLTEEYNDNIVFALMGFICLVSFVTFPLYRNIIIEITEKEE